MAKGLVLGTIGLCGLGKMQLYPHLIGQLLLVLPYGWIIGYLCAIAGLKKENTYWLVNIFTGTIIILAGVIIPVSQYPWFLKIIAELIPVSDLLDWLIIAVNASIGRYVLKPIFWLLVAGIVGRLVRRKVQG
ncbi:hypothetical protein [Lactobacillus corticis]|uniref:hypothetical protein n=1 Tax=Lactobacillus corticis TaxID=2201249 RepID=UPI001BB2E0A4|nr:hypothetical protein [Lactobacillus corticis]